MLKRFVGYALATLLLGGMFAWARSAARLRGTAGKQIQAAIVVAMQAANQGRVSQAMDVVSTEYKDSTGLNRDRLWILVHRAMDNRQYWDVTARGIQPRIDGRNAVVDVVADVSIDGESATRVFPVTLVMKLEDTHVWGVIPTQRWRVVSVDGLPDELLSLSD